MRNTWTWLTLPLYLIILTTVIPESLTELPPARRRAELIRMANHTPLTAIPLLLKSLQDENLVVRRTAVRLIAQKGIGGRHWLIKALDNSDFVTRMVALRVLGELDIERDYLGKALTDDNLLLRCTAVEQLKSIKPRTEKVKALLVLAQKDQAPEVRQIVFKALWTFHKETVSIRERKDWDHDVKVTQTIKLPKDGWKFHLDPGAEGHLKKWYERKFDDSNWKDIAIEQAWQKAGHQYVGVAWYRRWIELQKKPKHLAIEIRFYGVDENAWVWLNGRYVGQHDIGPTGWNVPFTLDITNEVEWGDKNQITVRAMNTKLAGGIWRPVQIEVLE